MNVVPITIFALFSIHLSTAVDISSNPIYEIVANTDYKKCYTCEENCSEPILTNCTRSSKCFSRTTRNGNITTGSKGCVDFNVDICSNTDEETSCYTCDGDFCNADTHEEVDLGVSRCYVCIDECPKPAVQHDCKEALDAKEGKPVKAACLTYKIQKENEVTVSKGCVPNTDVIKQSCLMQTILNKEVSCSICQEERCNAETEDDENYVDECYHCTGLCEHPVVQNCEEILGVGAKSKCVASEVTDNGEKNHWRTCVEITTNVQADCAAINERGGNCTICDTNLCNVFNDEGNYVDECYFCDNTCEAPLEIHNCKELLGENAKSKCIVTATEQEVSRGCVEINDNVLSNCTAINDLGGNCTICDTNLCNGLEEKSQGETLLSSFFSLVIAIIFMFMF